MIEGIRRKLFKNKQQTVDHREDISDQSSITIDDNFINYTNGPSANFITVSDSFADVRKRERKSIDVPASCGFFFEDVIVQQSSLADIETGELKHQSYIVIPDGSNLTKIVESVIGLIPFNDEIAEMCPRWSAGSVKRVINFIAAHEPAINREENSEWNITATMTVEPLTTTGRIKKYPICSSIVATLWAVTDMPRTDSAAGSRVNADMTLYFNQDGDIGKGHISLWLEHDNIRSEFGSDKSGSLILKKVTEVSALSGEPTTVYPAR